MWRKRKHHRRARAYDCAGCGYVFVEHPITHAGKPLLTPRFRRKRHIRWANRGELFKKLVAQQRARGLAAMRQYAKFCAPKQTAEPPAPPALLLPRRRREPIQEFRPELSYIGSSLGAPQMAGCG